MARQLHHRKKDNKYALWSTIVDDYVTEWEDKEEIRKQWYLDKFETAMKDVDKWMEEIDKKELENNGYSNLEIDNLIVMRNNLYTIIDKLEKE